MRRSFFLMGFLLLGTVAVAQPAFDTMTGVFLQPVIIRNNLNYKTILAQIKADTSFYKSFKNLRILGYDAYNSITMKNRKERITATYQSKTTQERNGNCRKTRVLEQQTTGDFFDANNNYNYTTAKLYASLFFANGEQCGEDNIVKHSQITTQNKEGLDKNREQLKMLFFTPGQKIPGIPFIGNKLDLYDDNAHKNYDYTLDYADYNGVYAYKFSILPKQGKENNNDVVVDEMTTWFSATNMQVLARTYSLSYSAGVYNFNVRMEVEMTKFKQLWVPKVLRYKGRWNVVFKGRENGEFTATLFNFK